MEIKRLSLEEKTTSFKKNEKYIENEKEYDDSIIQAIEHVRSMIPMKKRSSYLHEIQDFQPESNTSSGAKYIVNDPALRTRVLVKFDQFLSQNYGFEKSQSRLLACKFEKMLRMYDPSMHHKYKEKLLIIIKGLKVIHSIELEKNILLS